MRRRYAVAAGAVALAGVLVTQHDDTQRRGTPHTQVDTLRPCAQEDGPDPCVWDARTRGNGKGTSFRTDADGKVYKLWPRPIDGHTPCYVAVGPTSYVWCEDGFTTTS